MNHEAERATYLPFERILGVLAVLTASAVLFGFLVANIYLDQFGFWDFNFLRAQDVSAGILFLAFAGFPFILAFVFYKIQGSLKDYLAAQKPLRGRLSYAGLWLGVLVVILGLYGLFLEFNYSFLRIFERNADSPAGSIVGPSLIIWAGLISLLALIVRTSGQKLQSFKSSTADVRSILSGWIQLLVILLVPPFIFTIIIFFSLTLYPYIPRTWGGGSESSVVIRFKNNSTSPSPLPAKLIYESENSLLIHTASSTYFLPLDEVSSIQYPGENLDFQKHLDFIQALTGSAPR